MMNTTLLLMLSLLALTSLAIYLHWTRHQQKQAQKHDDILYPFCQLRRDIMEFLYQNTLVEHDTLTLAEYRSVRRLLDVLNNTIHGYSEHRKAMLNLRHVLDALQEYRHTLKQAKPIDITENASIQAFHQRFVQCCAKAFLAYTPLIQSEVILRLAMRIYQVRRQQYLLQAARQVRQHRHYGNSLDNAAAA